MTPKRLHIGAIRPLTNYKDFTFDGLSKFLTRSAFNEKEALSRVVNGNPEDMIATGEVIGPLRPVSGDGRAIALGADKVYFCRFRAGDMVTVAEIDPNSKKFKTLKSTTIKAVRFPKPGSIEIVVPVDEVSFREDSEVFLLPSSMDRIKWTIRKKLHDLEQSRVKAEHFPISQQKVKENLSQYTESLNKTQEDALRFLIENDFKGLVQGPPGTGKTRLLSDLVNLGISSGIRIGLASLSHAAIDNALSRIIRAGVDTNLVMRIARNKLQIRAAHYEGINIDDIWGGPFRKVEVNSEYEEETNHLLYAATLHSWCLSTKTPDIDILIIDEASQVPIYFYPFLEALCSRVIMFGDHKQLPPVIQLERHNLPAEDIFTYEIERGEYPMLETQYRMNEGVQEWPSKRFYGGRLQPHDSIRNRDVLRDKDFGRSIVGPNVVSLLAHRGRSANNANSIEAGIVTELVWELQSRGGLRLEDIGIVTPHRAQAGAICANLQGKFGVRDAQNILVDTVERFQGQEKEAMIFSMGVEKDYSRKGDAGFLGDGRRLNVAVTRAKSRFFCVAPERLVENTKRQQNAEHLNSFLGWCSKLQVYRKRGDVA